MAFLKAGLSAGELDFLKAGLLAGELAGLMVVMMAVYLVENLAVK
jgi:hypothetical protein